MTKLIVAGVLLVTVLLGPAADLRAQEDLEKIGKGIALHPGTSMPDGWSFSGTKRGAAVSCPFEWDSPEDGVLHGDNNSRDTAGLAMKGSLRWLEYELEFDVQVARGDRFQVGILLNRDGGAVFDEAAPMPRDTWQHFRLIVTETKAYCIRPDQGKAIELTDVHERTKNGMICLGIPAGSEVSFRDIRVRVRKLTGGVAGGGTELLPQDPPKSPLGIVAHPVSNDELKQAGLPDGSGGLVIESLAAGSPAARAGMRVGDLVIGVQGKWLPAENTAEAFRAALRGAKGHRPLITVWRNGTWNSLTVELDAPAPAGVPSPPGAAAEPAPSPTEATPPAVDSGTPAVTPNDLARASALKAHGIAQYQKKDFGGAAADFEEAARLNPTDAQIFHYLGAVRWSLKDFPGSLRALDQAVALAPKAVGVRLDRGSGREEAGDFAGALEDYAVAIAGNPTRAQSYCSRGRCNAKLQNPAAAGRDFDKALELDPKLVEAWYERGLLREQQRDFERAKADLRQVLALAPNHKEAAAALARLASAAQGQDRPAGGEFATQQLAPSDQPQTVSFKDAVAVTIPGGLLTNAARLTIAPSSTAVQLPRPCREMKILGAYDMSLGSLETFAHELTLEFAYDPTTLDPALPEGKNLWVSSWDPHQRRWSLAAAEVDTNRKRLVVRTDHLSTWLFWTLQGYQYVARPTGYSPFEVYYHPRHAQPRSDVAKDYSMEDLANDVLAALISARQAYKDAGFTPPNYQVKAVIYEPETSEMSAWTGNIHLKRSQLESLADVRQHAGHELFHVFQNQYFNVRGMANRLWWTEGTPEYASSVVAWKGLPIPKLDPTYFDESLFLNVDTHAYQHSQLIDYLVTQRKLSFKAMWDAVAANSATGDNGAVAFQNYVSAATGKPFAQVWTDFVGFAIFNPRNPLDLGMEGALTIRDAALADSNAVTVPSYAAKGIFVRVIPSRGQQTRRIKLSAAGLSADVKVEIWLVKLEGHHQDFRTGSRQCTLDAAQAESAAFDLNLGNGLEAIVINTGTDKHSVTITAQDLAIPAFVITPARIDNAEDKVYNFEAKAVNLAAAIEKVECEWDFGDGSDPVSFSSTGSLKDGYRSSVLHRFAGQDADHTVKAKLYNRTTGRVLLAEAQAQVSFSKLVLRTVKMHDEGFDCEVTGYFRGDKLIKKHGRTIAYDEEGKKFAEYQFQDGRKVHSVAFSHGLQSSGRKLEETDWAGEAGQEWECHWIRYDFDGSSYEFRRLSKEAKEQMKTSTGEWVDH